jgi:hypothetical protein
MAKPLRKRDFISNQIFVGLPWRNVRPRYERVIRELEKKYPVHFTIVGKNEGHDAVDLFEVIKDRIRCSSHAIFDATGGNPNVSLEYGYAEGIEVPRSIFLSGHKAAQRTSGGSPIISDLTGMRRVQYKNEAALASELNKLCREHDYTKRFELALKKSVSRMNRHKKKSFRTLALKTIRAFDEKSKMRRAELVQHLQARGYAEKDIDITLKKLGDCGMIKCTVGRFSDVQIS